MIESVIAWAKVQILRLLMLLWKPIWRFVVCPPIKILSPVCDFKFGIKQSRMRYLLIQFIFRDGDKPLVYQEVNSNGKFVAYRRLDGRRFIPQEPHEADVAGTKEFQFPKWGRIDWKDVFSGDIKSGCWGIIYK